MIRHHPCDDLLLALSAGRLRAGMALVVGVHVDGCLSCRERVRFGDAIGGALVDESEPRALTPEAWSRTLERIASAPQATHRVAGGSTELALPLPAGRPWPRRLRACRSSRWFWMGPGMRFARLQLEADPEAKLFLLRIGGGRSLPRHSHRGIELTQVLCGTFDDGRDAFGPGDFDATDELVLHQPVVREHDECTCLAYVGDRLRFEGRVAALVGGWVGM